MLTLYADVHTTRRRTIHHIMDENDVLKFSAARIAPCLDWLLENGFSGCHLNDGEQVYHLTFGRTVG